MGGRSQSTTSSTQEIENQSANLQAEGEQVTANVVNGNGNTVTATDFGAVQAGAVVANNAVNNMRGLADSAVNNATSAAQAMLTDGFEFQEEAVLALRDSQKTNTKAMERVAMNAASQSQSLVADSLVSMTKYVVIGLVAVAVIWIGYSAMKRGKR